MELPTQITLKVGETYTLRLASLATAGYVWSYAIEGDNLLSMVSGRALPSQNNELSTAGSSGDELLTLLALQPGQTRLHLTQHRPWETQQPLLKDFTIQVDISSA
jgi:predicted secreted protein